MNPRRMLKEVRVESLWLLGALLVVLAGVWPVRSLQKLPAQQAALQQQWMQVQAMAQEAQQLQAQTLAAPDVVPTSMLPSLVDQWLDGKASVSVAGDSVVLTLQAVPGPLLISALTSARQEVRAQVEHLQVHAVNGNLSGKVELRMPEER